MAKQVFSNNASALLAASISDSDLTIQVDSGYGALYPSPGGGDYFIVTLVNAVGDFEMVKVTSRAIDLLTVPVGGRGQEGTAPLAWTNGQTRVELRATKGTLEQFIQRGGDVMSGNLDMDANQLIDAHLSGTETRITGGQTVGTAIRGTLNDASNELSVPSDGSRATAGGQKVLVETDVALIQTAAFVVGQIIMWFGAAGSIPARWKLCNGANGTPDLRDKFIVGAGSAYALSAVGGATSGNTGAAGAHTPVVQDHTLLATEVPSSAGVVTLPYSTSLGPGTPGFVLGPFAGNMDFGVTGSGTDGPHGHGADAVPDHVHAFALTPPYYALYYIMYTG